MSKDIKIAEVGTGVAATLGHMAGLDHPLAIVLFAVEPDGTVHSTSNMDPIARQAFLTDVVNHMAGEESDIVERGPEESIQ